MRCNTLCPLCGLDLAQFSGDEPPEMLGALRGKAFKAIRPSNPTEAQALVQQFALMPQEPAFLIDAYHPQEYGGTGQTGDWALAAQFAQQYPLMLAGGLTPENVATAVAQVQTLGCRRRLRRGKRPRHQRCAENGAVYSE